MSNPFLAEIRIFTGGFAPKGWALCDGQLMSISQNTALFSLLGTTYGGNGTSNFALPNLQGCAPMQQGQGPGLTLRDLGETAGSQTVTLLDSEMPAHSHNLMADPNPLNAKQTSPQNNVPGRLNTQTNYGDNTVSKNATMNVQMLTVAGSSQPHNNMQPFLGLTYIIALQGVFPARS